MSDKLPDWLLNRFGAGRIADRQIDELIGIVRGMVADGQLTLAEVDLLHRWLAANAAIGDHPVLKTLYDRVAAISEAREIGPEQTCQLLALLDSLAPRDFELGEVLKPTTLPLNYPAPALTFAGRRYCFTGTFKFGKRSVCEQAVVERGGLCGRLTRDTQVLVVGAYATESWRHSSFGAKIVKATGWRDGGLPITIVSEDHWAGFL